jgi:CelD/BcsL family acetyltransferase involved in cellulose biosynthesis
MIAASPTLKVGVEATPQGIGHKAWNDLWRRSEVPSVFSRYEWVASWWTTWGKGLTGRIYTLREGGRLVGLLPTAWPASKKSPTVLMGDWHSDYAAILTDRDISTAFETLIESVCRDLPRSRKLVLSDVRSDSSYGRRLDQLAQARPNWLIIEETVCPRTTLTAERVRAIFNKDSLKRHSRKLAKLGSVAARHFTDELDIAPKLNDFFEQHVARWSATPYPSLFHDERTRQFYRKLTSSLSGTGLLLFTEIALDGKPVASHFGFVSEGDLVWYKPTFDPAYAKVAPGEVLIRELYLWASDNHLSGFDFTRGGEAFKSRFANMERRATTYGFYGSAAAALAARTIGGLKSAARNQLPPKLVEAIRRLQRYLNK